MGQLGRGLGPRRGRRGDWRFGKRLCARGGSEAAAESIGRFHFGGLSSLSWFERAADGVAASSSRLPNQVRQAVVSARPPRGRTRRAKSERDGRRGGRRFVEAVDRLAEEEDRAHRGVVGLAAVGDAGSCRPASGPAAPRPSPRACWSGRRWCRTKDIVTDDGDCRRSSGSSPASPLRAARPRRRPALAAWRSQRIAAMTPVDADPVRVGTLARPGRMPKAPVAAADERQTGRATSTPQGATAAARARSACGSGARACVRASTGS